MHLCCFFQGHVSTSFPHVKQTAFLLLSLVSRGCSKQRGGWGPPLQGHVCVDAETHICMLVCICVQVYMCVYLGTHMYICARMDIHTCVCVSTCGHYVHMCVCEGTHVCTNTPTRFSSRCTSESDKFLFSPCPQSIRLPVKIKVSLLGFKEVRHAWVK